MTVTPTPSITALPDAPQRLTDSPDVYVPKADAWADALPTFSAELVSVAEAAEANATAAEAAASAAAGDADAAAAASAAAVAGSSYFATSATSLSIGSGAKAFTLDQTGKAFANGDDVTAFSRSDIGKRIRGTASGVNAGTGAITITVAADGYAGAGTVTDWIVVHSAFAALVEGLAADLRLGTSRVVGMTPDAMYDSLDEVTLTDAATIAVDMSTLINAKVTLGGSRVLGNPTNPRPGKTGRIRIIQDATGGRTLSFASNWKRQGGAPNNTTTALAWDVLEYDVIDATTILYDLIRNPTS